MRRDENSVFCRLSPLVKHIHRYTSEARQIMKETQILLHDDSEKRRTRTHTHARTPVLNEELLRKFFFPKPKTLFLSPWRALFSVDYYYAEYKNTPGGIKQKKLVWLKGK